MNPRGILISPGPGSLRIQWAEQPCSLCISGRVVGPPKANSQSLHLSAGAPEESGICLQACKELGPDFPLFGVCMGHQCIGQAFGGALATSHSVRFRTPRPRRRHRRQSPLLRAFGPPGSCLLEPRSQLIVGPRCHLDWCAERLNDNSLRKNHPRADWAHAREAVEGVSRREGRRRPPRDHAQVRSGGLPLSSSPPSCTE